MRFRQSPATFTVEELPLFAPSGRGDHLYLTVRRSGMSTPFLLRELQRRLRLKEEDLGCAGMKDRDAVSVQTLSLPRHAARQAERVLRELGCEVLSAIQHPHKLRTGKLAGNRFSIRVELEGGHEEGPLAEGCRRIEADGLANAFGPQRFADGSAIEEGHRTFLGIRRPGAFRRSRFAVSVFQALLFNELLALRRARGLWPWPLSGDLMKRHDSGGEFVAEEVDEPLRSRVARLEISPTGPIFGGKMARPCGEAWRLECGVLASHGLTPGSLGASRVPGTRRFLRVPADPIALTMESGAAFLSFELPPGSYASVLLQELGVEVIPPDRPQRE
ncbi:MAG: tRNA pseudouridine(13) synthase TruD [Acidobacteriota bacterium]